MDLFWKVKESEGKTMMDQECINSIIKFIMQSNMSDLDFHKIEIRPIRCGIDKDGNEEHTVQMYLFDTMSRKASLSESWVAGNLLLFTVFDGYLENKYLLTEGASFRNHYDNLPENTFIEKISKNCYRIMKIIRNGIQHNMSSVTYDSGNYCISYCHRNTSYELQISKEGVRNLYTLIMNIIQGKVMGMNGKFMTPGHYDGIMYSLYSDMVNEITKLSDDIGTDLLYISDRLKLRISVRYPVENPRIVAENDTSITFSHIENNGSDDENSSRYRYSTDYTYNNFLLPQEIGVIKRGEGKSFQERMKSATISFDRSSLVDKWKIDL